MTALTRGPFLSSESMRARYHSVTAREVKRPRGTLARDRRAWFPLDRRFVQSTETIDTIQAAMEIDRHLSELETAARAKGSASGAGFLYPVTIDRVANGLRDFRDEALFLFPYPP